MDSFSKQNDDANVLPSEVQFLFCLINCIIFNVSYLQDNVDLVLPFEAKNVLQNLQYPNDNEETCCVCGSGDDELIVMTECATCERWYHLECHYPVLNRDVYGLISKLELFWHTFFCTYLVLY